MYYIFIRNIFIYIFLIIHYMFGVYTHVYIFIHTVVAHHPPFIYGFCITHI